MRIGVIGDAVTLSLLSSHPMSVCKRLYLDAADKVRYRYLLSSAENVEHIPTLTLAIWPRTPTTALVFAVRETQVGRKGTYVCIDNPLHVAKTKRKRKKHVELCLNVTMYLLILYLTCTIADRTSTSCLDPYPSIKIGNNPMIRKPFPGHFPPMKYFPEKKKRTAYEMAYEWRMDSV